MTLRSGSCESVLIKLSVRPSLRYSLPGSVVALTKGRTAIELIFSVSGRPRNKYAPAASATNATATIPPTRYTRDRLGAAAGMKAEEPEAAMKLLAAEALDDRPESVSRFKRARSARSSAAL